MSEEIKERLEKLMKLASPAIEAVRWNAERSRFETGSGYSTGKRDEIAWTHWRPLPPPPVSKGEKL